MARQVFSAFSYAHVAIGVVASLTLSACGRAPFDATPEGTVREFVERIESAHSDAKEGHAVFALLSRPAQASLAERARRASAATGKRMAPEQMLAPSYFYPLFQPRQWASRVQGVRGLVDIVGLDAEGERATVPCVLEDGHWRVDLALPELPAIEHRPVSPAHEAKK